jgi:hypothetical protein
MVLLLTDETLMETGSDLQQDGAGETLLAPSAALAPQETRKVTNDSRLQVTPQRSVLPNFTTHSHSEFNRATHQGMTELFKSSKKEQ